MPLTPSWALLHSMSVDSRGTTNKRTNKLDTTLLRAVRTAMRVQQRTALSAVDRQVVEMVRPPALLETKAIVLAPLCSRRRRRPSPHPPPPPPPSKSLCLLCMCLQLAQRPPLGWRISTDLGSRLRDGARLRVWFNASSQRRGDGYHATVVSSHCVSMLHTTVQERVPQWSPFHYARAVEMHAASASETGVAIPDPSSVEMTVEGPPKQSPKCTEKILYEIAWKQQPYPTRIIDLSHYDVDVVAHPRTAPQTKYGTRQAIRRLEVSSALPRISDTHPSSRRRSHTVQ